MKTFVTLLLLCLLFPSLICSENTFEQRTREHKEAAAEALKNYYAFYQKTHGLDIELIDERLDLYELALAEVSVSKENLEQILRILQQREARKNLSKDTIYEMRAQVKVELEQCERFVTNLNNNILNLSNAQKNANELLPGIVLKKGVFEKSTQTLPLSLDAIWEKEKNRRALFYSSIAFDGQKTCLYTGQFYQTVIQSEWPKLIVKVYEQEKLLYEESISLPSPLSQGWDQHLKEEGLLFVPKTSLSKEYGLDLRISTISEDQYLIAYKGTYSNYTFIFFLQENPLCTAHFVEPPPWQLGALTKPGLAGFSVPLCKQSAIQHSTNSSRYHYDKHPALIQFVQDMAKDPISLAQYVQNEIELDLNSLKLEDGLFKESFRKRSPLSTFLEGQGSPSDQCDLLVHLLELAGYNAALIRPNPSVALPSHFAEKLLFVDLQGKEQAHLAFPGVLFRHGNKEIALYPWIKEIKVEEGYDLYNLLPNSFASQDRWIKGYLTGDECIVKDVGKNGGDDTAAVLFLRFLEEELKKQNLSINDVGIDRKICKREFNDWEDFPRPYTQSNDKQEFLFSNKQTTIEITIGSYENPNKIKSVSIPLPALNGRAMELAFSPSEFCLHVDNAPARSLALPIESNDYTFFLKVSFNKGASKLFSFVRGIRAALCFHTGRVTSKHLDLFKEDFEKEKDENKRLHRLLSFMGMAYFEKCSRAEQKLAALHKVPPITCFAIGLAKLSPDLSTGELVFPQVDMQFYANLFNHLSPVRRVAERQIQDLFLIDTSSNEHQILRDLFQDLHPVSTVKLLEIADRENRGILAFTKESFSQVDQIPFLQLRALSRGQWETLKTIFNDPKDGHLSYAYMTPELILNGEYCGMGSLILHPYNRAALISDHHRFMHGGFGSRLPPNFLTEVGTQHLELSPYKNGFTLLKISDQLLSLPTFETKNPLLEEFQKTWLTADVRPGHKLGTNLVSDPVDVVTGAFYVDEIDLTLPGPFPLQIRRNYSNQSPLPGVFGFGWKLGLNPYLHEEGDKLFAAEMDGTVIVYRLNGDRYEVFAEDNPELRNFGGTANPFHAYIKDNILYGPDGSRRVFKNRLLREWIDAVGNTLSFDYDGEQLVKIENSTDNFVRFHYNPEGKISEAFTKDGRWVKYHYTYQGDLDQVTLPNGAIIAYAYDGHHQITQESRPCDRVLENNYDEKGRVFEQRSPVGPQQQIVTSATFKFDVGMTTVIDGEGGTTQYLIYDKQIYKITDPVGEITYQSWFIDEKSYFEAQTGQVLPWEGPGAYLNSLKTTQDKRGLITEYRYDSCGNPTTLTLIGEEVTGKQLVYNDRHLCVEEVTLNKSTRTFYHDHFVYLSKRVESWIDDQRVSTTHFEYDEKGQLTCQNANGAVTRWIYKNGFPTQIIQETGTDDPNVVTTLKYNRQGQCIEKASPDGKESHEYDIMGNNLTNSIYDLSGKLLTTIRFGYNLNNQKIWQQGPDPLNTLFIDYNAAGQVMATRQSLTQVTSTGEIKEAGFAYTLYEYDARGELIEEVNPLGVSTSRTLDPIGRPISITTEGLTTRYTYEAGGFIASTLSPMGAKTTRCYTTNGLLKKELYPDGTESLFVYDYFGRPIQETRNGITSNTYYDDLNRKVVRTTAGVTETQCYDSRGLLTASTDGEGNTWEKTYDGLGRPKTETSPDGQQTIWNYNGDTITCHHPSGEKTIQHYQAGQLIKSETFSQNGTLIAEIHLVYEPERSFYQKISGDQTISTWSNTFGQPLKTADGLITQFYHYDPCGQCIESIDGESHSTHFQFDHFGRLAKKILPDGASIGYSYDNDSHLIACHLPQNLIWNASYDQMGRKTIEYLQAGSEISQQWQYSYEKGLLQHATDPMDRTHTYFYDALSRLEKEIVGPFTRSFTYDNRGLITSAEELGNDHSKVLRSYDSCGRLISESIFLNSTLIQQTDQSWTPNGRTLNIDGHKREFFYEAGHLKTVSTPGHTLSYDYSLNGTLIHKTTPFISVDLHYKASLPETIITHLSGQTHTESLKWTPLGKLSSYESNKNKKSFSYTSRGHLKSAGEEKFTFDNNRLSSGIRTSANHHQVPQDGIDAFGKIITELIESKTIKATYDSLGQTISRDNTTYQWDPWGRLTQVTSPNSTWKASYDPFGRRLKTTHSSGWWPFPQQTLSYYDPQHEFQEIGLKSGSNTFWKIYGPTSCELILDNNGNSVGLLNDALGNLIAILTPKEISWKKELPSVYGPLTPAPAASSLLAYAQSLTWQGKQQDPTGLIHFGARYYDPLSGRFLSQDPISYPISLNLYSYANGDPINFRDPDGRFHSPFYQPITETVLSTLANPRVQGGFRIGTGVSEIGGGALMLKKLNPAGFGMVFLGTDNVLTGSYELITGQSTNSVTYQLLRSSGLEPKWAAFSESIVNIYAVTKTIALELAQNAVSIFTLPKDISSQFATQTRSCTVQNLAQIEVTGIANAAKEVAGVQGFTIHAVNRAIDRGVSPKAILDALKNPLKRTEIKIDHLGRPSQRLIGQEAEVVINPNTKKIVSVNPTSSRKAEKLMRGLSDE